MFETHFDDAGQLVLLQAHACGVGILFVKSRVKHSRIIGREHNGNPVAQEFGERMIFDSCILATELPGEGGRFHIAPRANFEGNLSLREQKQ
jgi:hypothetical protein